MYDKYSENPYNTDQMYHDHNGMSTPVAFLVGAAMGFVGALLLAPQSGRATREQIRRKSTHLNNIANGRMEQAKGATQEFSERAREKVNQTIDRADEAESQGRDAARRIVNNNKEEQ
ncbi:hypothetical protein CYG49_00210 [Candidatus Saccharibacteria bacterium]|nr:MAG: hypothetical protein CYG49_00210 [Candidatus Saccharibacteria bacterium]